MATYLYCVLGPAAADAVAPGVRGLAGSPVRSITGASLEPIEAWVATMDEVFFHQERSRLAGNALVHNDVVNAAIATKRAVVPARFGTLFADDSACERDLVERRHDLLAMLDRVAGSVEIPILIVLAEARRRKPLPPDRRESGAGRRYLEAVREQELEEARRRVLVQVQADRLGKAVADIVRAETRRVDRRGVLSLAHLVPQNAVERYRRVIEGTRPDPGMRVVLGETRAPYSFTEIDRSHTGHDSGSPSHDD